MIHVEMMGCTSAGKSTFVQRIRQICAQQQILLLTGDEFVLQRVGLGFVKTTWLRLLLINLVGCSLWAITLPSHYRFSRFALAKIKNLPVSRSEKLLLARNVCKRIGVDRLIRWLKDVPSMTGAEPIILVDEGTLQIAHNLFVYLSASDASGPSDKSDQSDPLPKEEENLRRFAALTPMPDVVVYLKQDQLVLIQRTLARGHNRIVGTSKQLSADKQQARVQHFINQAVQTFETLSHQPAIEERLVVVDGAQKSVLPTIGQNPPITVTMFQRLCTQVTL